MIDIENYMKQLIPLLRDRLGCRLRYVGLQGSYLRGEANDLSDVDIMVVVDALGVSDLDSYRSAIQSLDYFDQSCGFICSTADLINWNPLEICHLLHSTKDYCGALRELVPVYTESDIRNFVKMSVNNLYHEICHRYIHGDSVNNVWKLPFSYKGVFFILQNLYYLNHGEFVGTKAELLSRLKGKDRAVLERALQLKCCDPYDFPGSFELLFAWCQETIKSV